ncbi:MAG: LytTR family DNA-binding domain-containing protein, partial [Bacteroidota bacterium]
LFKDAELGLPQDKFFRPKRGYLVNLDHVRYVNTDHILMKGDYKVPLTKARRRVWLNEFDENL